MSMEELLEKVAREVGVGCSGESDSDEYGIARDILKRFLLPLLEAGHDRGTAEALLYKAAPIAARLRELRVRKRRGFK